ncbi:alpha/beta hydrolase [Solimonas fluminis]|uniref:Alpha/beta hydrolase n=1 Tax=Solimonas fluminis TaxID=2086571 RepID=A0A2S5TJS2_9GAMM|nr:alpha/beta fold hydrolase [Solimonas fluminis]PPE75048.1 alpha/beta hydrolase [Solimonas fluminis]
MPLHQRLIHRSRRLARTATHSTVNLRDRLLRSEELVQAERTPFEVIHREGIAQLRYYPPLAQDEIELPDQRVPVQRQTHAVPLVLVSPLAVNMLIYDLFEQRSLVRYLRARGFELYLVDWGRPDSRHDEYRIGTYVAELMPKMLAQVRAHSGSQRLSLHGWSFGGLFSYAYAALSRDPDIVNLALVGAPCDYHNNGMLGLQYQRLSKQLRWLRDRTGFRPHNTSPRWWRSPGWANSLAFKLTNPVASLQGYFELLRNLHDREFVSDHATNGAFLDGMVAYPGGVMQDIVQYLWADNVLAKGRLPIKRCEAELRDIDANLLLVAGTEDVIVTTGCTHPILEHARSPDKTLIEVPGGHMGILGGSKAPLHIWPQVADWLAARST